MKILAQNPVLQFLDQNGPLVGGLLYTYEAGTLTPLATYTDSSGATANSNPITLDANGACSLFLTPGQSYKFRLVNGASLTDVWTKDNIAAPVSGADKVSIAGNETISGSKVFSSTVECSQYYQSTGSLAGYRFTDRTTTAQQWVVYADAGQFRVYSPENENIFFVEKVSGHANDKYGRIRGAPPTTQNANYTFVATDNGLAKRKTDTGSYTYTINASTHNAGDQFLAVNGGASGNITLAPGAGVTMRLAGTTTTGSRTVAPYGQAFVYMFTASEVWVSGPGVT